MKAIKTLSKSYDLNGLKGKLLLCDPNSISLTPSELYIRSGVNEEWVEHLKQLVEEGADLDPVVVAKVEGKDLLVSGNHRVSAYRKLGKEIKVLHIGEISLEEFFKLQRELNPDILPMDTEELRRYAEKLYDHLKGKYKKEKLYEKIADAVGRSPETVRKWLAGKEQEEKREKIRRAIELREKGWKVKDIAKELGVDERTVYRYLEEPDKMGHITKMTLLTPAGDPTPEGIRLFEEYLRTQDRLPPAWNWENFSRWLEGEGKEVEGDIKEFVSCFIKPVSRAIKLFAGQGEEDWNAVTRYLSAKEPLSRLTAPSRDKLFAWAERYWKKELEEIKEQNEKASLQSPSSPPSAGTSPALSEETLDDGIPVYRPVPSREKLYEMAYGGEEKKEEKKRPPSKYDDLEKTILQIRAGIKWIYAHFGKKKALSLLEELHDEITALPESKLAQLEGNI